MKVELWSSSDLVVFATREFAQLEGVSLAAASKRLRRLAAGSNSLVQLTRGVWANRAHPYFSAFACVPALLGSEQGYVSFLSALHVHGALAQIPATVQVATTGHARSLRTPIGAFEFLQLKPEMILAGVAWSETAKPYRLATVEKALLDTLYISTRKKRRFAKLPELALDDAGFELRRYRALLAALKLPPPIATAIGRRWHALHGATAAAA